MRIQQQAEDECLICGKYPTECVCPICSECGQQGDPNCIKAHMEITAWRQSLRSAQTLLLRHPKMKSYLSRKVTVLLETGGIVPDK